jgi:hypothetical protein
MSEQPVVVNKISWADLCPWTIIFRTLPIAASITVLSLALLGVVLTPAGWWFSDRVFLNDELRADIELMDIVESNTSPYRGVFMMANEKQNTIEVMGMQLSGPRAVFNQISRPFSYLFSNGGSTGRKMDGTTATNSRWGSRVFWYFLLGCVWSVFVWSFVGVAITRVCLLKLTRSEQAGLDDAFEYAIDHSLTSAGAIGVPLLAVAGLCIPAFLFGLLMTFDFGVAVAGILWVVVLALSAVMAILLAGLMFGWPLIVASVGAEGQNSFDAMTRAYAYTFQRPLHYLGYMVVAMIFGGLCWFVVMQLSHGILNLSYWATSWGSNLASSSEVSRMEVIQGVAQPMANGAIVEPTSSLQFGQKWIGFWNGFVRTIAASFIYGLFWCMAAAIYLLLRKDVDDTEMDEVFIVDEKRTYELPPLKSDEQGIPQVQTPTPVAEKTVVDSDADSSSSDTIVDDKDGKRFK